MRAGVKLNKVLQEQLRKRMENITKMRLSLVELEEVA
jgi:hypothetical protein